MENDGLRQNSVILKKKFTRIWLPSFYFFYFSVTLNHFSSVNFITKHCTFMTTSSSSYLKNNLHFSYVSAVIFNTLWFLKMWSQYIIKNLFFTFLRKLNFQSTFIHIYTYTLDTFLIVWQRNLIIICVLRLIFVFSLKIW